ncbi:MAG: cytochrome c oxidase subunit I, partial [bacterium]
AGNQRRIYDPTQFEFLQGLQYLHEWSTYGLYGLLGSQVFLFAAIALSFFRSMDTESNPWEATTLEWLAPPAPGHGNFETVPSVHRRPYEFNHPDHDEKDYWPQWEE